MKLASSHGRYATSGRSIEIGETAYVSVFASKFWNPSGINVCWGQKYTFLVPQGEQWSHGRQLCDANGHRSIGLTHPLERLRRIPQANWLELIATIGKSTKSAIMIGRGVSDILIRFSGQLYFFANDLPGMYWSNTGALALRVTRTS